MNKQLNLFSQEQLDEMIVRKHNYKMVRYIGKDGLTYEHPVPNKTKEQFVTQARAIWGDRYDYTDSIYTSNKEPITIYCPKHDFHFRVAMAQNHILKPHKGFKPTGCPICSYEEQYGQNYGTDWQKYLKLNAKQNRASNITNFYNISAEEKARIKAEREAERKRKQAERERIREEEKAQHCKAYLDRMKKQKEKTKRRHEMQRAERIRLNELRKKQRIANLQARFRAEALKAQGAGYIYKGIEQIVNKQSRVMVHCPNPDHEWHPMRVDLILQGCKCRECVGNHQPLEQRCTTFISNSQEKYGTTLFDYSRVPSQYVNNDTPVEICCLQHNYWFPVTPDTHLRKYGGCPICNYSKGETEIKLWLNAHGIKYKHSTVRMKHHNPKCKVAYLVPDFYLPDRNTIIEYNGDQHYKDIKFFRRNKSWTLADQQERDRTLRKVCHDRKIRLIEISYVDFDNINKILDEAQI